MEITNFFLTLVFLLLSNGGNEVYAGVINTRDNACTACLATIQKAVTVPEILNCSIPDDQKAAIMHQQVCSSLATTPLFGFCEAYVDAWSPGLYTYLAATSTDPQNVCAHFKAC